MQNIKTLIILVLFVCISNAARSQTTSPASTPTTTDYIIEDTTTENDTLEIKTLINYFSGNYKDLYNIARKNKKIILLDFTASWCLPCAQMNKYTFNDVALTDFLNEKYFVYRVNMEEFDAFEIAENFKVKEFPTFIFLNYQKKVLQKITGFQSAKNMLSIAKKYH